jgi:hypothetical protein
VSDLQAFEYPHCPLRRRAHAIADRVPGIRRAAGAVWPAARRADRVELDHDHLHARSLAGFVRIGWEEITTVRRSRTGLGRVTLAVEAAGPSRRIEIAESLPGFEQLARMVRERASVGEVVELRRAMSPNI